MKTILLIFLTLTVMLISCTEPKTFTNPQTKTTFIAEPYGLANTQTRKADGVLYELSAGNVFWSIVLCETIVYPIYFVGWNIYQPIRLDEAYFKKLEKDTIK